VVSKQTKPLYEFGPYRLDVAEQRLLRNGQLVPLPPKVFDTLLMLVERGGRMIEKDELMTRLWPDTFVGEAALARNISDLRKALGEGPGGQKYIETVPKRGYRFMAGVKLLPSTALIVERHTRSRVVIEEEIKAGTPVKSVAVLPFTPLGANVGDEYFGLGMADALITRLSRIRQIIVRPTSAVFKYDGGRPDAAEAGRELRVEAVLEGSIQHSGNRIRVSVRLVSVSEEATLWADQFDQKFTDIFAVEDAISQQVAEALTLRLTGEEKERLKKHYTENAEAYQAYLRGRFFWNKRTTHWLKKGVEYFQQAVYRDPDYALAYVGLADSYTLLVTWEALPPEEGFSKAKQAARSALAIDGALAEAHAGFAHTLLHTWEWGTAESEFKRALDLNPGYGSAHQWYSEYLAAMGRFDESIAEIKSALALDPLSVNTNADVGRMLYLARRYDEAIGQLQQTVEMEPNFWLPRHLLGQVYIQKAMYEEALAEFQKAMDLSGKVALSVILIGHAYAVSGKRSEALAVVGKLEELSKQRYFSPYRVALIHAGLGDKDKAVEWLERAYEKCDANLIWLNVDPLLDGLRSDPRLANLVRRVGLTP